MSGRCVTLTPHPLLMPLVMKEYSYTSTPPMGRRACTERFTNNIRGIFVFYQLSLLYNGYRVFPGDKERPGRDADPSPPSSADGHEKVELYRYSPYGPYGLFRASVPVQGCTLPLPLQIFLREVVNGRDKGRRRVL
jgi:hypothetical protein